MVWAGWLYSQEWWRRELWRNPAQPNMTFDQVVDRFRNRLREHDTVYREGVATGHAGLFRRLEQQRIHPPEFLL